MSIHTTNTRDIRRAVHLKHIEEGASLRITVELDRVSDRDTIRKFKDLELWYGGNQLKIVRDAIGLLYKTERKNTKEGNWVIDGRNIEDGPEPKF